MLELCQGTDSRSETVQHGVHGHGASGFGVNKWTGLGVDCAGGASVQEQDQQLAACLQPHKPSADHLSLTAASVRGKVYLPPRWSILGGADTGVEMLPHGRLAGDRHPAMDDGCPKRPFRWHGTAWD
ncbi:hypothetical protein PLESTM_001179300 [Pleodorina starrii]|nr:hypothetical protein PLESTM_001179300 [Pleodorina starrii]